MVTRLFRAVYCVLVLLAPRICFAIGDGADAIGILGELAKLEAGWTLFVLVVFLLLRLLKMSNARRLLYCIVLWAAQFWVPYIVSFGMMLRAT